MKKLFIILILFASCTPQEVSDYSPTETAQDSLSFYINQERVSRGFRMLVSEKRLTEIATAKTLKMIESRSIDHNGFVTREKQSGAVYFSENLGYGFCTQKELFEAYMRSERHKENIINNKITHIGSYSRGKYNTCLFAKYD